MYLQRSSKVAPEVALKKSMWTARVPKALLSVVLETLNLGLDPKAKRLSSKS